MKTNEHGSNGFTRIFSISDYPYNPRHQRSHNNGSKSKTHEPSHDQNLDTHADDYNSQHGKACCMNIGGELHLTDLIKS